MNELERQATREIGYGYTPLNPALSESSGSLAGPAVNVGTYSVGYVGSGANYTFDYPDAAVAVSVRLSATWAAAADASRAYCMPTGGGVPDRVAFTKAAVSGYQSDGGGIVNLDTSGTFSLVVANANTTGLYLYITGYFS